jgi:hypothetical protein
MSHIPLSKLSEETADLFDGDAPYEGRACVCSLLPSGACYYCKTPRTGLERLRFVAEGVPKGKAKREWTKDEEFEAERKRLKTKKRRKKGGA